MVCKRRKVFDCKLTPQELLTVHSRLGHLDMDGWDEFITGVIRQVMDSIMLPNTCHLSPNYNIKGITNTTRRSSYQDKEVKQLNDSRINNNYSNINLNTNVCKHVKNINIIRDVSVKDCNKQINRCTAELLASEALKISMKERFQESTKVPAMKELQKSMKLLVLLLLDTSIKKGLPNVNRIHNTSVQLAMAALQLGQSRGNANERYNHGGHSHDKYNHATSVLCVLYLQLSLAKMDIKVRLVEDYSYTPLVYHGPMSRHRAERILRDGDRGTFLIRTSESSKSGLVLSVNSGDQCVHIKIEKTRSMFVLGRHSPQFPDLVTMVAFYSHHHLPLGGHGLHNLKLVNPAMERLL